MAVFSVAYRLGVTASTVFAMPHEELVYWLAFFKSQKTGSRR